MAENTTAGENTAVGSYALSTSSAGSKNTCIGYYAGKDIDNGEKNVAIGTYSGCSDQNGTADGHRNVSVGYECGKKINTGNDNTGCGYQAIANLTTGHYNAALGMTAGDEITDGDNNTMLGWAAGSGSSPSGSVTTGNNIVCLGNNDVTNLYCADTSISSSDKRDKTDVVDFTNGLNWINQLKPVTYRWDKRCWYDDNTPDGSKKRNKKHIGFLAQDVLAIEGNPTNKDDMLVVNLNEDDSAYGLKYERLVPVLVNAIKELSAKVTALEAK
jgi:hypothetical protein